jgi:hypothetical protein
MVGNTGGGVHRTVLATAPRVVGFSSDQTSVRVADLSPVLSVGQGLTVNTGVRWLQCSRAASLDAALCCIDTSAWV